MTACNRTTKLAVGIGCSCFILALGITCAVLGAKGFFTFKDPCMGVQSFDIKSIDLTTAEGGSSNVFLSVLDTFTNGMASEMIPTQVVMELEIMLEVNNTNPYDASFEQTEEGTISIPLDIQQEIEQQQQDGSTAAVSATARSSTASVENVENDLVVGTWAIPDDTLRKRARNSVPVTMKTSIDLLGDDTMDLATKFVSGGALAFRIHGEIKGSGWLPGFSGTTSFICLAMVDDILKIGENATVKCQRSLKVGVGRRLQDPLGLSDFFADEEVDPACYV